MKKKDAGTGVTAGWTALVTERQAGELLARLQRLTQTLYDAASTEQILNGMVSEGLSGLGAVTGTICLLTEDGAHLEAVCDFGSSLPSSRPPARIPLNAPVPIAEAARTGQSLLLRSKEEYLARYPHSGGRGAAGSENGTFAAIPLQVQDQVLGAICVVFEEGYSLQQDECDFLETIAKLGGLVLERQRLTDAALHAKKVAEHLEERLAAEKQGESTRARNFFDNLSDGFIAYDREWLILYVNDAAAASARMSREEMEGKIVWDLFPELRETAYAAACRQVMNDHVAVHREDCWPGLEFWYENHIFPVETGIAVMFRDITERKQTEAMLARQTQLLEKINTLFLQIANVNDPDTILELAVATVVEALKIDGCVMTEIDVDRNWSEVLSYYSAGPPTLSRFGTLSDLIPPEWLAWYQQGRTRVVEDTACDVLSGPFRETYYAPMQIGAFVSVPFLRGGKWTGTMGVYSREPRKWPLHEIAFIESVAQRAWLNLANARLLLAERERSEQLSLAILEVHHRVKNNLQAVSALLEMQLSPELTALPVEAVLDSLSQIKTIALVHDLLARDKPIGAVNVAEVLVNLAGLLSGMRRTEHPLSIHVEAVPIWMTTKSATSLSLAANELLTNAVKHYKQDAREGSVEHAEIEVRLERQNEHVLLIVQDHGPGFPPDFDPNLHANLGLQLVLTLVEHDLHGTISFTNHFDPNNDRDPEGGRVEITFCEHSIPD